MQLHLNESWTLSNEHAASSYGQPVLVEKKTNQAHGPGDILKVNPNGGAVPGYMAVRKMTEGETFSKDEIAFIDRFII